MSDYIRRTECLAACAKINTGLCWLEERVKELRRDMKRLESENRDLREKVRLLELSHAMLKGQLIGCQQGIKESRS